MSAVLVFTDGERVPMNGQYTTYVRHITNARGPDGTNYVAFDNGEGPRLYANTDFILRVEEIKD